MLRKNKYQGLNFNGSNSIFLNWCFLAMNLFVIQSLKKIVHCNNYLCKLKNACVKIMFLIHAFSINLKVVYSYKDLISNLFSCLGRKRVLGYVQSLCSEWFYRKFRTVKGLTYSPSSCGCFVGVIHVLYFQEVLPHFI